MAVIYPAIATDPDEIAAIGFNYYRSVIPGWEPADGDLMTWLIAAHARMIAEERDVAADVPAAIFRYLGPLHGIVPLAASAATIAATITVRDTAGYSFAAGMEVLVRRTGDDGVAFATTDPVTIPPGETTGEVTLRATEAGTVGNGFDSGSSAAPIRSWAMIDSVRLIGASTDGADGETDGAYLERLRDELALTSPVPILPADFAALARRHPAVWRALPLNLYDPATGTWDNERMCPVAVTGRDGLPLGRTARGEVSAMLEAARELNWRSPVIDATYTSIDVAFDAVTWPGWDPVQVRDAALAAVPAYLSPATFGAPPGEDPTGWLDDPFVRLLEVAQALNEVPGLRHLTRLQIGPARGPLDTRDVPLPGPAPLPQTGTVTGDVTEI